MRIDFAKYPLITRTLNVDGKKSGREEEFVVVGFITSKTVVIQN